MDALIKEVQQFISVETHLAQAGLAKLCGYSTGVISAFLANKYTGDVEKVKTRVIGAIELYRERAARQQPERFVATDQSRVVESAMMYALKHKQSAAVLAESGLGKSITARHIATREFGIVYCGCDVNDFRQSAFLDRLADALGMGEARPQSSWKLQRQIQERLTDTEWVIVVDDAHYLIHPNRPSRSISLDVVKDLQANAGTPFVLLGVPELWHTIATRVHGDWYAQLKRRIGTVQFLRRSHVQADDVECVVGAMGAKCGAAVLNSLTELAREPGGYGNVEKAIRWATRDGFTKQVTTGALKQYLDATSNVRVRVGRASSEPPAVEQAKHAEPAVA